MCDAGLQNCAKNKWQKNNDSDFIFSYKLCLYRAKISKTGKIKIKQICTGVPSITGAKNMGDTSSPNYHYKFKIESKNYNPIEMLLSPKEFTSNYTFKKSILGRVPVLFRGSKGDFEMFIEKEMNGFDFSPYHKDDTN